MTKSESDIEDWRELISKSLLGLRRRRNLFSPEQLDAFNRYLDAPHDEGYWRLTANWPGKGQVQDFLIQSLIQQDDKQRIQQDDKQSSVSEKEDDSSLGSVVFTYFGSGFDEARSKRVAELTSRISTLLQLFDYCLRKLKYPDHEIDMPEVLKPPAEAQPIVPETVRNTFQEAFRVFAEDIWFEDLVAARIGDYAYFVKTGAIFVHTGPRAGKKRIDISSLDNTALESFTSFLRACGAIDKASVERVFAPEEVLLTPYFAYLRSTFEQLIDDERNLPQLQQAFDYYKNDDFQHCISTLGIIAEDYFTQVYSTFFREPCEVGWTLGQIYDNVHSRLRELLELPKQEPLLLDDLYDLARKVQAAENVKSELAEAIRRFANVIKRDRAVFQERIEQIKTKPRSQSIFPKYLQNNIEELIRNRNAASHKTRVPLGKYEAQKTLHSLVSIIFWWTRLKKKLPWKQSKAEILQFSLKLALEDKRK
jgi:hypothetical protein